MVNRRLYYVITFIERVIGTSLGVETLSFFPRICTTCFSLNKTF